MRLNGEMRHEIKRFAIAKLDAQRHSFALVEQELLVDCYNAAIPASTRAMIAELEKHPLHTNVRWMDYDTSLRFNVAGQTVALGQNHLPSGKHIMFAVPHNFWHQNLGTFTVDKHPSLVARVRDWQGKVENEEANYKLAVKTLDALLKSVSTVEKLKQYWPEGRDFFSSPPCQTRAASGVPAVQIEALNKMLGITTEEITV